MSINAYNILYPEIPSFKAYEKELGDIEFPLSVKLCVREIYNVTKRYEDYGYKDARVFFFGHSYIKEGYVGWNGNFENGSLIHVKGRYTLLSFLNHYISVNLIDYYTVQMC